jgi:hypothetical protein
VKEKQVFSLPFAITTTNNVRNELRIEKNNREIKSKWRRLILKADATVAQNKIDNPAYK